MSEAWNQWQGQVIDGKFHLEEYLGGNGQSAVFRTQLPASSSQNHSPDIYSSDARWRGESKPLAIKLIADSPNPELQLSRWRMAQGISHPHLLRIIDTGRCTLGQIDLIFAVMEYAEENLAQIIPERSLNQQEACAMLAPVLDALTYLHGRGLVHGHLKPANIMAANDVLKLSIDSVSPVDEPISATRRLSGDSSNHLFESSPVSGGFGDAHRTGVSETAQAHDRVGSGQAVSVLTEPEVQNNAQNDTPKFGLSSLYAAPETAFGAWTPAADVWSLGVTLAEVLTQHLPSPAEEVYELSSQDSHENQADPLLPKDVPAQFVEIVRGCIRRDLRLRWTIPAIQVRLSERLRADAATAASPTPSVASVATQASQPAINGDCSATQTRLTQPVAEVAPPAAMPGAPKTPVAGPSLVATRSPRNIASLRDKYHVTSSRAASHAYKKRASSITTIAFRKKTKSALAASYAFSRRTGNLAAAAWTKFSRHTSTLAGSAWGKTLRTLSPAAARIVADATAALRKLWIRAVSVASNTGALPPVVRHFALPAVIAIAALVAIYAGLGLRHEQQSSPVKPAPITAAAPPQQSPSTRRPSPRSRKSKPNAGRPLSAQPVTTQQAQSQAQPSQAQQPQTQQTAITPAEPDVRHFDDGGAADTEHAAASSSRADAASTDVNVMQRVLPQASPSALATIHGTVRVNVKVQVDHSGNVARAEFASPGPSRYFARLSLQAAQDWKFAPGRDGGPFLLRFEFTRGGVEAFAMRPGS